MLATWIHELQLALRGVYRAKGFYSAAVLTLAIGMAGATVMFTLIRGILLRPLPVADEDRLVVSWRVAPEGPTHVPYRAGDVEEIGRASRLFAGVTGVGYNGAWDQVWADRGTAFTARTAVVMGPFFAVTGVTPVLGRALTAGDDREGAERAVVLSHAAWQRIFAGEPAVVGRRLVLRSHGFVVVGVMPPDFEYPRGVELWTSRWALAGTSSNAEFRATLLRDVEIVARLRPEVTVAQATAELATITADLDARAPGGWVSFRPVVRRFKDVVVGDINQALAILFAAVVLLLVIAGANVANLLLMRGEARRREFVVRAALGARRSHIVRQHLAESLVVTAGAAAVGLVVTTWCLQSVTTLVPDGLPRLASIRVDGAVVAFTATVALFVATLSGLVPALLAASSLDVATALRAGGRGVRGGMGQRGRRALMVTQVALAVAVVAAASLLTRSLERLQAVDMGLAHERLVLAELDVPLEPYGDGERRRQFLDAVVERLRTIPAIDAATPINSEPFSGDRGWDMPRFTAEGQSADQVAANPSLNLEAVHPTYFSTLGVSILRGRGFTATDRKDAPRVAIVDDAMASRIWPGQDPIGRRLKYGALDSRNEWLTVVGLAATTRYRELATPRPTLYVPAEQLMIAAGRLAIRTTATPQFVAGAVREAVHNVAPDVRVVRVSPYAEYLRQPLASPRFNALLLLAFAAAALLMSSIGLYGVMAASVRQRHAEIGVRLALGSTTTAVARLVLGEGLRLALFGAVAGLTLAFTFTRLLRGLLFQIEPLDPVSLLGAAAVLVAAAVLATYLPARRATRVDPVEILRTE
jgi:putative ABC transport system permease protein